MNDYRYNLVLPKELFEQLRQIGRSESVPVVQLIRQFIKLGLMVLKLQNDPSEISIFVRKDNEEQEIRIIF